MFIKNVRERTHDVMVKYRGQLLDKINKTGVNTLDPKVWPLRDVYLYGLMREVCIACGDKTRRIR